MLPTPPSTRQRTPFIVLAVIGFYYFGPQQPLSGLGVLVDHHQSVCVPLPIARQRKTILFVCLPQYPFLLWFGCLLSPYPSWHAPSGSNLTLLLLGGMSSQRDTSPKRAQVGTSKQVFSLSLLPNHAILSLTHDLTVSCIGWVQAGEVWALRVPFFHICPKSACCSCVCHGWPAQFAVRFLLFFGSPFLYGLPYLGTGPRLMVDFAFLFFSQSFFLQPLLSILLYHSYCEIVCLNLAGPLWACHLFFSQWPSTAIGSFIASLVGSCVPFVFPQASRALLSLGFPSPFLNFAFPWAFTKFFGLPWPNYIIP